jgi:hypothetical protein
MRFPGIEQPLEYSTGDILASTWMITARTFHTLTSFSIHRFSSDFSVEKSENLVDQTLFRSLLLGHVLQENGTTVV